MTCVSFLMQTVALAGQDRVRRAVNRTAVSYLEARGTKTQKTKATDAFVNTAARVCLTAWYDRLQNHLPLAANVVKSSSPFKVKCKNINRTHPAFDIFIGQTPISYKITWKIIPDFLSV